MTTTSGLKRCATVGAPGLLQKLPIRRHFRAQHDEQGAAQVERLVGRIGGFKLAG